MKSELFRNFTIQCILMTNRKLARVDPEYDIGDHISAEVLGQMTDDALFELHSYMRETLSLLVAGRK